MKRRIGLVSNSSSSSFTCDCCGYTGSGWDASPSNFEMSECKNGHLYCDAHEKPMTNEIAKAVLQRIVDDNALYNKEDKEEAKRRLAENSIDIEWAKEIFFKAYDSYERPKEICPICTLEYITDSTLIEYLLKTLSREREAVESEIRVLYKDYDEMSEALKK